jgi:hypothetical protein
MNTFIFHSEVTLALLQRQPLAERTQLLATTPPHCQHSPVTLKRALSDIVASMTALTQLFDLSHEIFILKRRKKHRVHLGGFDIADLMCTEMYFRPKLPE